MKDSTKRRIAYEICFLFRTLRKFLAPLLGLMVCILLYMASFINWEESLKWPKGGIAMFAAISTFFIPCEYYHKRLIRWLKRWNPDYKPLEDFWFQFFYFIAKLIGMFIVLELYFIILK